eukprot:7205365-Prymnesium_polylepis.1
MAFHLSGSVCRTSEIGRSFHFVPWIVVLYRVRYAGLSRLQQSSVQRPLRPHPRSGKAVNGPWSVLP